MRFVIKVIDIIIIILVTGFTLFIAYSVYMKPQGNAQVIIRGEGSEWNFPLDAQETIVVQGILGKTIIKIDGGNAQVLSSPCVNQTCVATGVITKQGQWAACLPNNVLLMIRGIDTLDESTEGDTLDAVVW